MSKKHKLPKIREAHQNKMAASNGLQYGLGGNTLIQRLYPRDIDMANFHRVYNAENSIVVGEIYYFCFLRISIWGEKNCFFFSF